MENEAEDDRPLVISDTTTRKLRTRAPVHDFPNIEVRSDPMLSPFCGKPRGSIWLELLRHIRHDVVAYTYHAGIVTAFYIAMIVCFYMGTHKYPPKTEASMRYVVNEVFTNLVNDNGSMVTRFYNVCLIARNDSIVLWRYDMFRFFDEAVKNESFNPGLLKVFADLEGSFVNRLRLSYIYELVNASVFSCDSIYDGLNQTRRIPPTNSTIKGTIFLRDLADASIDLIKTYALHPPYVKIRRTRFDSLCISFVPAVTANQVVYDVPHAKAIKAWLCPSVMLSAAISTKIIKEIIDNSSSPIVLPNCTWESEVYLQQADIALNGDAKFEPQRYLRRAYLMQELLSEQDEGAGTLPAYMYPLVIISAWTHSLRQQVPRISSIVIRFAFLDVAENKGNTPPAGAMPWKLVVDTSLVLLRREYDVFSCQEIFVNVYATLIKLYLSGTNASSVATFML